MKIGGLTYHEEDGNEHEFKIFIFSWATDKQIYKIIMSEINTAPPEINTAPPEINTTPPEINTSS